jgi:hypothetical protein
MQRSLVTAKRIAQKRCTHWLCSIPRQSPFPNLTCLHFASRHRPFLPACQVPTSATSLDVWRRGNPGGSCHKAQYMASLNRSSAMVFAGAAQCLT